MVMASDGEGKRVTRGRLGRSDMMDEDERSWIEDRVKSGINVESSCAIIPNTQGTGKRIGDGIYYGDGEKDDRLHYEKEREFERTSARERHGSYGKWTRKQLPRPTERKASYGKLRCSGQLGKGGTRKYVW